MKINESGRSMIEMLGVLAIIGVLSVGGIAGYSKAMAKFRSNKTIDQVSHIVANTRILFGSQRDYSGLGTGQNATTTAKDVIGKAKLLPDEMISGDGTQGKDWKFTNAYAGSVAMLPTGRLIAGDNKAFVVVFTGIPQEACIDLAAQDWGASSGSGFISLTVKGNSGTNAAAIDDAFAENLAGVHAITYQDCSVDKAGNGTKTACGKDGDPMSVLDASIGCAHKNFNTMIFKFY